MPFDEEATCKFIRDMSAELSALSAQAGLTVLSYTLGMAQLEASSRLAELQGEHLLGLESHEARKSGEKVMAFAP